MASLTRRRSLAPPELALAVFYAASVFGYLRSQQWPGAWLLGLPALAGLGLDLDGIGDRLRRRGERDVWLLVGLAGVVGFGWTLYAMVSETLLALLRGVIGSGLVLMGAFFLAGRRVWRPERGLIPAGLGALVVGGLDPFARMTGPTAVAVLGLMGWLALERPTRRRPGAPVRRSAGLVAFTALALALAAGIGLLLPWAQPFVERAAAGVLAAGGEGVAGLSSTARLGDIESVALSREVVLRLWSQRPLRLRAHVLTHFDGRTWSRPPGPSRALTPAAAEPGGALGERIAELPGASYLVGEAPPADAGWARVLVARLNPGQLVAPAAPRLVRVSGSTPLADPAGILTAPFWPSPRHYGVAYARGASTDLSEEERQAALQLPEGLDPRLGVLARRLAAETTSDRARLDRTVAWIGRQCAYSLDVGAFRSDQPVAEFLFEKKRGYCEYFASGAALLLRLQGVPTRFVSGFSVRDQSRRGDHYLVRAGDAHAWVEVWIADTGWVEADPTPAAQYDALRAGMRDGPLARAWEPLAAFFAELNARIARDWGDALRWAGRRLGELGRRVWRRAGGVLLLLAAAVAALHALRWLSGRRRRLARAVAVIPSAAVAPELAALLGRVERRWSELGHPRPPHRAPLEHLVGLPDGALTAEFRATSRAVVDCYYRARFSGRPPEPDEVARLRDALGKPSR